MEGIELIAFQIIASVGSARSSYIEAIQAAKAGNFEEAEALIKAGDREFNEGHHAHASLIQKEANQEQVDLKLLLMHAEDQLMSAEGFKVIAQEFIDVYDRFSKLG
ncbi:PTS lactose/cellobiose transporter subunit IIA [Streptococcus hillyeri]|uniref:PTS lactose/cellobiose transporter subunit IIA n=1 Tax=Streptococcus hillyeri TaxID=2282420 RepID=A0A3L9DUD7_9STRE|nr:MULTISPECIES: PTS lactose/cellobiose transporter subunit IIA [Streptococcus]RLY03974.1 PTS lactose/cellobiose transporter subunit IIA [Streptococcus hillyeri]